MNASIRPPTSANRREFLRTLVHGSYRHRSGGAYGRYGLAGDEPPKATEFQIACMTLPYSHFPLERALQGIQDAGYRYVAWGTDASRRRRQSRAADGSPMRRRKRRPSWPNAAATWAWNR